MLTPTVLCAPLSWRQQAALLICLSILMDKLTEYLWPAHHQVASWAGKYNYHYTMILIQQTIPPIIRLLRDKIYLA